MNTVIPVENGDTLRALQGFFRRLFEAKAVDALLLPMHTGRGMVTSTLISDVELLDATDPLAPVMPGNAATLVGKLSVREPRAKVGAVLRSCELRALVELVKLQQANMDDLLLISVDCAGTYSLPVYLSLQVEREEPTWKELYTVASTEPESEAVDLRLACQMCEQPTFDGADISINLLASDIEKSIRLSLADTLGERLGLEPIEKNGREGAVDSLVASRTTVRDALYSQMHERLEGDEGFLGVFDACIRCHNCMNVCPICYCKTCVFKSSVFDHEPMQYMHWARHKGAVRLPADSSLFHLTRLNHMGLSCVGCGMCTQACPADLPVGLVFRAIGQRLQQTFDYLPGRSVDETLPLITFKEDEWTELGED